MWWVVAGGALKVVVQDVWVVGLAPGCGTTVRVVTDTVVPGAGLVTRVTTLVGVVTVRVGLAVVVVVGVVVLCGLGEAVPGTVAVVVLDVETAGVVMVALVID